MENANLTTPEDEMIQALSRLDAFGDVDSRLVALKFGDVINLFNAISGLSRAVALFDNSAVAHSHGLVEEADRDLVEARKVRDSAMSDLQRLLSSVANALADKLEDGI